MKTSKFVGLASALTMLAYPRIGTPVIFVTGISE